MTYKRCENHVEIYFDSIPDKKLRESLKICGWYWYSPKKCWRHYYSDDNIRFAKELCEEMNPKPASKLLGLRRRIIGIGDLIVRSNGFYCNMHHDMEDIAGEIEVRDKAGHIILCLIPIVYCKSCDAYYVLEGTYKELKKKGWIISQVLSYKEFHNGKIVDTSGWSEVSPLRKWGYTVNQTDEYSDRQRQAILEDILDYGVLSRDKVLSYLDFFIMMHKNEKSAAVEKWKNDRAYISHYKLGSAPRVRIGQMLIIDHQWL